MTSGFSSGFSTSFLSLYGKDFYSFVECELNKQIKNTPSFIQFTNFLKEICSSVIPQVKFSNNLEFGAGSNDKKNDGFFEMPMTF